MIAPRTSATGGTRGTPHGLIFRPVANSQVDQATQIAASTAVTREREPDRHVARPEEAVADRLHEEEDRVDVRELLPRRGQHVDRVEDAAEERQRQDHEVVDEGGVVPALGVDPDDDAERAEQHQRERDGEQRARAARGPARRRRAARARAARPPMSSARTTPPSDSPRLTSHARMGAARMSLR